MLRELQGADAVGFHLTAILARNETARRLLEAGLPGLPRYSPVAEIKTFTLATRGRWVRRCECGEVLRAGAAAWVAERMRG